MGRWEIPMPLPQTPRDRASHAHRPKSQPADRRRHGRAVSLHVRPVDAGAPVPKTAGGRSRKNSIWKKPPLLPRLADGSSFQCASQFLNPGHTPARPLHSSTASTRPRGDGTGPQRKRGQAPSCPAAAAAALLCWFCSLATKSTRLATRPPGRRHRSPPRVITPPPPPSPAGRPCVVGYRDTDGRVCLVG